MNNHRKQTTRSAWVLVAFIGGCQTQLTEPPAPSELRKPTVRVEAGDRIVLAPARRVECGLPRDPNAILIGLDADMSSNSASAGEAIRRGAQLAIDTINERGGVLSRKLELVVRDHRGNPIRGIDNLLELAELENLVAVVGGVHTPVALEELPTIHAKQLIYLGPWAAGTPIVSNGYHPNYVFRVSVRDEYAGEFLVESAIARRFERLGLLLERTGWGESNRTAIVAAINARGAELSGVEWFHWDEPSLVQPIQNLVDARAQALLLVANAPECARAVTDMASLPSEKRLPILSHWGIASGEFPDLAAGSLSSVDLSFLQTFSFFNPQFPDRARRLSERYCSQFADCDDPRDIDAAAGTAHAYDLVCMLAVAIQRCGNLNRSSIRDALESLPRFEGIVRNYTPPFRPNHHDALTLNDLQLMRFDSQGVMVPLAPTLDRQSQEPTP